MTALATLQIVIYFGILLLITKPLGSYMARVFAGERTVLHRGLGWLERGSYRVLGVDPTKDMKWTTYAVAMLVFAGPLTATTFGYGKFDAHDVQMASYALMAYSWGLLGFSLVKVLAPGYFARQDTKTPVRVGLIALGVNMAMNLGIALPAVKFGFPYPHILIATATCMSAAVNTTLLWRGLARAGVYKAQAGWTAFLTRILFANALMAALLIWLGGDLAGWLQLPAAHRALRLAGCIAAAVVTYFAALYVAGTRLRHVRNAAGA